MTITNAEEAMKNAWVMGLFALVGGCILDDAMVQRPDGGPDAAPTSDVGGSPDAAADDVDPSEPVATSSPGEFNDYVGYLAAMPLYYRAGATAGADNTPANNQVSNAGAHLGRVLFYDVRLSANDSTSCGSCHIQSLGFADPGQLSEGFAGGATARHSMSLTNARFYGPGRFFWDERAATLEDQVLMPIQDSVEMGMSLDDLEMKLADTAYYPELFEAAFGDPVVTRERIALALAQFVRSLVSYRSRFDRSFAEGPGIFTEQERLGQRVFEGARCNRCHTGSAMVALRPENNGLDLSTTDEGAGAARFKVPSLRNVAVGAPYMHDGRFQTLEQVVEHYDSGVRAHPDLSPLLRVNGNGPPVRLGLTAQEKAALVAFLGTLTDEEFLADPRFSDPFTEAATEP